YTRCPTSIITWLEWSSTECTDSASIDELPVMKNPMNFATAIPALAASAARMALVLPAVDICRSPRLVLQSGAHPEQFRRLVGDQPDRAVVGRHPRGRAALKRQGRRLRVHHDRAVGAQQTLRALMTHNGIDLVAEELTVDPK